MDSRSLAQYIEATDSMSKPWLLLMLRLSKLQERKDTMEPDVYVQELSALQEELMGLGEWWVGIEDEVFGASHDRWTSPNRGANQQRGSHL